MLFGRAGRNVEGCLLGFYVVAMGRIKFCSCLFDLELVAQVDFEVELLRFIRRVVSQEG